MKITVAVTTWRAPFDQIVQGVHSFSSAVDAKAFINEESKKWWDKNDGLRSIAEVGGDQWEPIGELGYDSARYELWDGEVGFHAMIDAESYATLHEEHYKREYDDKGEVRPGYLVNAYVAGDKPGSISQDETDKYTRQQQEGLDALTKRSRPN